MILRTATVVVVRPGARTAPAPSWDGVGPFLTWQARVEAFSSDPRVGVLAQRKTLVGFPALQQRRRPAAHIWLGRRYGGTSVLVLVHDLHIRVLSTSGRLLRDLTLDPSRDYQPQART